MLRKRDLLNTRLISLPFTFAENGAAASIEGTDLKRYRDKVYTILTTNDYERIWYLHYGASIQNYLMNPSTEASLDIFEAINEAFVRWAPELELIEVTPFFDDENGVLEMEVVYKTPTLEVDSVKLITAELTRAGETVRIIYNG